MWQLLSPGIAWEPKGTVSSLIGSRNFHFQNGLFRPATATVGSGQCFKTSPKLARQLSRIARECIWSTSLGILELRPSPDTRKLSRPLRLHILIAFCISDQILRGSSFYKLIWVGTTLPSRNESYCRIRITAAIAGKLPP
jgi:hypothetical protein